MQNNGSELTFPDVFAENTTCLSTNVELARYVSSARGNRDNYESDDNITARVKQNNDEDIDMRPPDDSYKLYGMYN